MTKKEIIWREILNSVFEKDQVEFTQKNLAQKYGFSLSTVFNALKVPRKSGIIEAGGRGFKVLDKEKFLYLWATFRNLKKDTIYQTALREKSPKEIEAEMPAEIIFGAFSAFSQKYQDVPADYDKVYVYSDKKFLSKIKERFPYKKGYFNLIILLADPWLAQFGKITPDVQTFVDLWNLPEWYAKEFLEALKIKMRIDSH
jgi:DNA-binding transcriptional MocR family regulator